jgi:hypothetical protein
MRLVAVRASTILLGLSVFLLAAADTAFAKVRVDYDRTVNFSKYRTFMWMEEPDPENPLMKPRIINSVNGQLMRKGLEPEMDGADLAINVTSTTEEVPTYNTFHSGGFGGWGCGWGGCWWGPGSGWGWGPGWGWDWGWHADGGWSTTTVDYREEGTLIVELLDTRTQQTIWRGVSKHSVSSKPHKAAEKLQKEIREMFEEYPPGMKHD